MTNERRRTVKWIAPIGIMLALAVTVACGDDDEGGSGGDAPTTTVEAANEQVCNELEDVGTAIEDVQALDADSTFTEVDAALSAVEDAWGSVEASANVAAEEDAADDVEQARADLATGAGCS
jgi:hypothetical protein